jgi:hypothetical protein
MVTREGYNDRGSSFTLIASDHAVPRTTTTTHKVAMPRIPRRFAPLVYGIIQAAITSAVATTIATGRSGTSGLDAARYWLSCWSLSWLAMLPVVVLVSPLIQRAVLSLTARQEDTGEHQ